MPSAQPDLFQYLDHRKYLSDWFDWKKSSNPRFSHRVFARLAGQRSPSLLSLVMKGERNLTERTLSGFIKAMALDEEEAGFFALLVQFDGAASDAERNTAWEQICANQRFQMARRVEGEAFRYLSHWHIPAIREMVACPGFQAEPEWLAGMMEPAISEADAAQGLQTLRELSLVRELETGKLELCEASVVTPHEVAGLAVHNYHKGMIRKAEGSIEAFSPAERHLGSVTVGISEDMVPTLKKELSIFLERLLDMCDSAEESPNRVYQINLQMFPLSKTIKDSES
jgi:uncharacterized protein (TIGR02147 family)